KLYKFRGKEKTLPAWGEEVGLPPKTINMRLNRGWDIERALTTPVLEKSETGRMGAEKRWSKR
ncbi:MAG: hypothetical protein AAFX93_20645, partial [Verrucomicrobiota bacterium]